MTEERRPPAYARRRDLREPPPTSDSPLQAPAWAASSATATRADLWPGESSNGHSGADGDGDGDGDGGDRGGDRRGPTTQELALYRRPEPALPTHSLLAAAPLHRGTLERPPEREERGDRARAAVERWSQWAAGLGRPPRDPSGRRRYPVREGMLPPALLIAAGLGVAALVGLLTGVLVSGSGGGAQAAAVAPTITVTQQVTPPAVTDTRTRTRTRTVTSTVTAAPVQPVDGGLTPGAQGDRVTRLQQDLATLGIYRDQPTGSYDEPTRAAVQNFQARYDVTADPPGVAGQATLDAVDQALGR